MTFHHDVLKTRKQRAIVPVWVNTGREILHFCLTTTIA